MNSFIAGIVCNRPMTPSRLASQRARGTANSHYPQKRNNVLIRLSNQIWIPVEFNYSSDYLSSDVSWNMSFQRFEISNYFFLHPNLRSLRKYENKSMDRLYSELFSDGWVNSLKTLIDFKVCPSCIDMIYSAIKFVGQKILIKSQRRSEIGKRECFQMSI